MRRLRFGLLAGILALGACQPTPAPGVRPRPGATSSARPVAPTGTMPTPAPIKAAGRLLPPTQAHVRVAGEVRVDAGYLLKTGQGRLLPSGKAALVSNNGGALVGDAGGGIISDSGASIISDSGASLFPDKGGGLIADAASGRLVDGVADLLAAADAGLLSDVGGSLIANNGGGILSDSGASLIGKTKYGLAQAAAPALGTELPAAGMHVMVIDMRTGRALPIGVDAAGKPVHVVFTDAAGRYALYLPGGMAPNVRVVTLPPGARDGRLVYNLVAPATGGGEQAIDEGTAGATRLLRISLAAYFTNQSTSRGLLAVGAPSGVADETWRLAALVPLVQAAGEAGLDRLRPSQVRRVAQATADALCAYLDLDALRADETEPGWVGPPAPVLPAITAILREIGAAAAPRLAADPDAFRARPFLRAANDRRAAAGLPPYVILKPADLGDLVFHEHLTAPVPDQREELRFLLADLGLPSERFERLRAASSRLLAGVLDALAEDAVAREAAIAALRAATAEELARPPATDPAGPPATPAPAPPWHLVGTLAGETGPAGQDGPVGGFADGAGGPSGPARFNGPSGLATDGAGRLFVADRWNHRVRMIDLRDPAFPVTTLAGSGPAGGQDGPAAEARFAGPSMLCWDGAASPPALYVSEAEGHRIRRITLPPGGPAVVDTLAGTGEPGYADGPGSAARFAEPRGLAVDGRGTLYVADAGNHRVRAIALGDPAHAVTTVAGSGEATGYVLGDPRTARFRGPNDVLVDRAGRLLVLDAQCLYRLAPGALPAFTAIVGDESFGEADGFWAAAAFDAARQMAFDAVGRLVVVEEGYGRVRRVGFEEPDAGWVASLAGRRQTAGQAADGPGDVAGFFKPVGVAVGPDGMIYVADTRNHRIRALKPPAP